MRHLFRPALLLALTALFAAGSLHAMTGVPAATAVAKLAPQVAAIAAASGTPQASAMMTRSLAEQRQPRGPAPLAARWNGSGQVQVYLGFDRALGPPASTSLSALGATGLRSSSELGVVQAWVPATALYPLAALPQITRITLPRYAVSRRNLSPVGAQPRSGSVTTQGDQILGTAQFRQATGLTGTGVSVGIISDGAGDIATDQGTGDLPTSPAPYIDAKLPGSGFEGTAMMEIVYDMAPGAKLGFCGPSTTVDFITCLNDFAAGTGGFMPNIIADDLGFPGVALFTDGGFATAVKNFAIAHPNIRLVSAAGNDAQQFWSGTWTPTPVNVTVNGVKYTQAQNFGNAGVPNTSMTFPVAKGDTVTYLVQWDDTWVPNPTSSTPNDPNDYDVFLTDTSGNVLACNQGINLGGAASPPSPTSCVISGTPGPNNTPGPQPVQGNQYTNNGTATQQLQLHIYYGAGNPGPHLKVIVSANNHSFLLVPNTPAGSIYGQSALQAPYEITTTAIDATNAQSNNDAIEPYASQGPVFFSQPATGTSTRQKPDFTAVDCVLVTGVGGFGTANAGTPPSATFCGTSATSEAVAAIMALLEQAYPGKDPYAMLQAGAKPLGSGNPNGVYGYGLVNAYQSGVALSTPLATISAPAGNISIQTGQSVSFAGSCAISGPGGSTLSWSFGSSGIASSTSANPSVTFATAGTYTVTLTCTNTAFNTTGAATRTVTVTTPPPPPPSGGGGGALGLDLLAALSALAAAEMLRRGRMHARG